MATGRTLQKYSRIYAGREGNYYPSLLCGLTRSFGPLAWAFDEVDGTTICDAVHGVLPGQATISTGPINLVIDPAAADVTSAYMLPNQANGITEGEPLITQICMGIRAAPAQGDPVFGGIFPYLGMSYVDDGGLATATYNLGSSKDMAATDKQFDKPWGSLLHAYGAETGANSAGGVDNGAATTNGGYMLLNIFLSDAASVTFKVQHSTNNTVWNDLTGASIAASGGTAYSYYAIVAKGTTVAQYLRWQMTTATNTFVMSFIRG